MRCFAIAEELSGRGFSTVFLNISKAPDWARSAMSRLKNCSFINKTIQEFQPSALLDYLILDSYNLNPADKAINKSNWMGIAALVDPISPEFDADLLISPSLRNLETKGHCYFGPDFIPIRKDVFINRDNQRTENSPIKILLTGGGTDPFNFINEMLKVFNQIEENFELLILTKQRFENLKSNYSVCAPSDNLNELLQKVDLAISPASTSSFEFIVNGIPLGIASVVENQEANYFDLYENGLALAIGGRNANETWTIDSLAIQDLILNKSLRNKLKRNQENFLSMNGASNIVDLLISSASSKIGS